MIKTYIHFTFCDLGGFAVSAVEQNMQTKLGLLKKAATALKKAAKSKVVKNAGRTLQKQYQDQKGLLRTIDKKKYPNTQSMLLMPVF